MAMSKGWKLALGISIPIGVLIAGIRLFWGDYGTDEYRILANLQIIFMVPSVYYAIDKFLEAI